MVGPKMDLTSQWASAERDVAGLAGRVAVWLEKMIANPVTAAPETARESSGEDAAAAASALVRTQRLN